MFHSRRQPLSGDDSLFSHIHALNLTVLEQFPPREAPRPLLRGFRPHSSGLFPGPEPEILPQLLVVRTHPEGKATLHDLGVLARSQDLHSPISNSERALNLPYAGDSQRRFSAGLRRRSRRLALGGSFFNGGLFA